MSTTNYIEFILNKINYYFINNSKYNNIYNEIISNISVEKFYDDIFKIILLGIEYINTHITNNNELILQFMYYDIYDDLFTINLDNLLLIFIDSGLIENEYNISLNKSNRFIYLVNKITLDLFYKFYVPRRSYKKTYIRDNNNLFKINKTLTYLQSIKQPEQRTDEWYIFRNSTLTASNIYKIFQSNSSQSQLIIEKSEPCDPNRFKNTNIMSPMHWGQKYEPVSIMYYEWLNNTKVNEFGCLPHKTYNFLAASPDGIVCDTTSKLYGRMIEIKNVVSREITGIPKMEYWIQMQLQMEVCDLDECDFLETKFIEYTDIEEFIEDISANKFKGIIVHYTIDNQVVYEYSPFNLSTDKLIEWSNTQYNNNNIDPSKEFIRFIYWKLDVISLILVLRNRLWFSCVLPYIKCFWETLQQERESGEYVKRKKIKRERNDNNSHELASGKCLIDL